MSNKMLVILSQPHADILSEGFVAKSNRVQEINFFDLCADYDLQIKLNLASAALLKPVFQWQTPTKPEDIPREVAFYLADFKSGKDNQKQVYDYLMTNPVLQILWKE